MFHYRDIPVYLHTEMTKPRLRAEGEREAAYIRQIGEDVFIVVNASFWSKACPKTQKALLAHEYGHYACGHFDLEGEQNPTQIELQADAWAVKHEEEIKASDLRHTLQLCSLWKMRNCSLFDILKYFHHPELTARLKALET